jgi:hypothetical protein
MPDMRRAHPLSLALLAVPFTLLAIPFAGTARADDPCAEDVKRLCPTIAPGGGRVDACLGANASALSAACRDRRQADEAKVRAFLQEFMDVCSVDLYRLCPDVKPGGGRINACLSDRYADVSSSCRAYLDRIKDARNQVTALRDACRADVERLCVGVQSEAGPLVACLQEHEQGLSPACTPSLPLAMTAVALLERIEKAFSAERIQQTLEVLQGLDSVAFTRSQLAFQFDTLQGVGGQANANRLTFSPQFVFGHRNQFALSVKVPVSAVYPYSQAANPVTGLGAVNTGFGWAFFSRGQMKQFLGLGVQFKTATSPTLGSGWAVQPIYAIALGLARWVSVTTQVSWTRSFAEGAGFPEIDILQLRPIVAVALPASSFAALDTTLGWDLVKGRFLPIMKGVLGKHVDRQKSVSISTWVQGALTSEAAAQTFRYGFGLNLSYFFDW